MSIWWQHQGVEGNKERNWPPYLTMLTALQESPLRGIPQCKELYMALTFTFTLLNILCSLPSPSSTTLFHLTAFHKSAIIESNSFRPVLLFHVLTYLVRINFFFWICKVLVFFLLILMCCSGNIIVFHRV